MYSSIGKEEIIKELWEIFGIRKIVFLLHITTDFYIFTNFINLPKIFFLEGYIIYIKNFKTGEAQITHRQAEISEGQATCHLTVKVVSNEN